MSAEQDLANANVQIANLITEVTRFRDAAMGLNDIYPTITEGRQTVADGKYFSVPGSGAYMRLYRRQGTTAELIAEFADRSEINGILDQLGPLLGRGVVGGSGDLMAQNAFGLGEVGNYSPNGVDIDTDSPNGFWRADSGRQISAHWPFTTFIGGMFQTRTGGGSSVYQILIRASRAWFRSSGSNPFIELFHSKNILGTVLQSGGEPTGAIIERGSNASGNYAKFADGTVLMDAYLLAQYQNASYLQAEWNYPVGTLSRATPTVTAIETLDGASLPGSNIFSPNRPVIPMIRNSSGAASTIRIAKSPSSPAFVPGDAGTIKVSLSDRWY